MLGLQFAIGVANDLADVARDRIGHPQKPLPAGLVTLREARVVFAVCAAAGLALAASVRMEAFGLALLGLADGLLYDIRLKGTPWSWLPFAAGVALLPVFAWIGASGVLPVAFLVVVPMALFAGAILATTNALADLDSDRTSGTASIATHLGRDRTLVANGLLLVALLLVVAATSLAAAASPVCLAAELAGGALGWLGLRLAASSNKRSVRLSWEVQAVGIVIMGAGCLAALASAGLLGTG